MAARSNVDLGFFKGKLGKAGALVGCLGVLECAFSANTQPNRLVVKNSLIMNYSCFSLFGHWLVPSSDFSLRMESHLGRGQRDESLALRRMRSERARNRAALGETRSTPSL